MNENNFKPFDKVLVRHDNNSYWACDLYSHYVDDNLEIHCCVGGLFSQVIPYEGNEALLGTTDAPKPKRWRAKKNCEYYYINSRAEVVVDLEASTVVDNKQFNIGNYFRTKEEAEEMAVKFKQMLKGGQNDND